MSREHQQLRVRVPPELKDALDKAADENNRTLTAEIVYRLQQSFENPSKQSGSETGSTSEDHRISSSDSKKLKGLLSRMLEMVEMAEQDEAREIVEENEAYESRAELDEKTEQSKGNESADERYKDNQDWGKY